MLRLPGLRDSGSRTDGGNDEQPFLATRWADGAAEAVSLEEYTKIKKADRGTVFLRMGDGADASSLLDRVTAAAPDAMGAALVTPGTTVMSV